MTANFYETLYETQPSLLCSGALNNPAYLPALTVETVKSQLDSLN